jgi:hypothetical protein
MGGNCIHGYPYRLAGISECVMRARIPSTLIGSKALVWHIPEKEVLVTFDELGWTVRKGDQGVIQEQFGNPKSESIDPKTDSGARTGKGQNKAR